MFHYKRAWPPRYCFYFLKCDLCLHFPWHSIFKNPLFCFLPIYISMWNTVSRISNQRLFPSFFSDLLQDLIKLLFFCTESNFPVTEEGISGVLIISKRPVIISHILEWRHFSHWAELSLRLLPFNILWRNV